MPTKMRLQRRGKKGQPFYHIVIADGRAPRDGKSIEKIGTYNPLVKPAGIDLNFDRALDWLQKGAQPTDTVRSILSYKGVLYKYHLLKGVKKGAFTEEQAEARFQAWLNEKNAKIEAKTRETEESKRAARKERIDAEAKVNEARAQELAAKKAAEVESQVKAAQVKAAEEGEQVEETVAETPDEVKSEEVKAEVKEEVKAEESPAEEPKAEEPKAEAPVKEEKPVEDKKEEEKAEPKEEEKKEEVKAEAKEQAEEVKEESGEEKKEKE